MTCDKCSKDIQVGEWPFCPHGFGRNSVLQDTIDEWNENVSHAPVHFTSKQEKKRYLKEHGLYEFVRHVGNPGGDKSDKTSRWV